MVRPKKYLGQHFLKDESIAKRIVGSLDQSNLGEVLLEVGPGMGVLTGNLLTLPIDFRLIEIDGESVSYLKKKWPSLSEVIEEADFLRYDFARFAEARISIIGNFPYNISSQIFFKALAHRDRVCQIVGMVQKEVGQRIASPPGSKQYGILSVMLQAFYNVEYLFTVGPEFFNPPPKVDSAVLRLVRNETEKLDCHEDLFFRVIKQGFQNRRKTLRNALKPLNLPEKIRQQDLLSLRAEQLSVNDFINLTNQIDQG